MGLEKLKNKYTRLPQSSKNSQGFTLIEALVTIVVMSIGLLGMAALQNTSVKFTYDSYLRTQSSLMASDLFDRMRANPTIDYDDLTIGSTASDCVSSACTPAQLSAYDVAQWRAQRDAVFGTGNVVTTIAQDATTPEEFTLTFQWDSRTSDGDLGAGGSADDRKVMSYTARVK